MKHASSYYDVTNNYVFTPMHHICSRKIKILSAGSASQDIPSFAILPVFTRSKKQVACAKGEIFWLLHSSTVLWLIATYCFQSIRNLTRNLRFFVKKIFRTFMPYINWLGTATIYASACYVFVFRIQKRNGFVGLEASVRMYIGSKGRANKLKVSSLLLTLSNVLVWSP